MSNREREVDLSLNLLVHATNEPGSSLFDIGCDATDFVQIIRCWQDVETPYTQRYGVNGALAHDLYDAVARFAQIEGVACDVGVFLH